MIRVGRGLTMVALATLAASIAGCSIPSWVPLIGTEKPVAGRSVVAPAPEAPRASAATLLSAKRERLPDGEDVMDRVICVVNNDAITFYELVEAEARYLHENKETPPAGNDRKALRERLLGHIIENRIQLQQAEREKITVEEIEITEQVAEIMQKVGAKTQPDFEEMVKREGLTFESVKKRIRDQIMVQRLTRRKVALRVSVTEQEIDRYLGDNRDKLETGLSFQVRHILFLPASGQGDAGWDSARMKADQVYALLLDGQDFAELARQHSQDGSGKDGGDLGTLKRGELAPDIEDAILKLAPGQFSPPFRSQVGYHLFRLESRESLSGEALVRARSQIREILYRQKYDARLQEWLTEIKQRAIIDVRL